LIASPPWPTFNNPNQSNSTRHIITIITINLPPITHHRASFKTHGNQYQTHALPSPIHTVLLQENKTDGKEEIERRKSAAQPAPLPSRAAPSTGQPRNSRAAARSSLKSRTRRRRRRRLFNLPPQPSPGVDLAVPIAAPAPPKKLPPSSLIPFDAAKNPVLPSAMLCDLHKRRIKER
jgi:hypothetical protein